MKILYCIFAVLLILPISSWSQDYGDHRNVQFSTRGTDFWVCFPPMQYGGTDVTYVLMPVPEHDCDVTVSNERLNSTNKRNRVNQVDKVCIVCKYTTNF